MNILKTIGEYCAFTDLVKTEKKSIGFVATMGALHAGHLSLIHSSNSNNDITVCSIFVNPTQFNECSDYKGYPREIDRDLEMLKSADCDVVFTPSESEMYPEEGDAANLFWSDHIKEADLSPLDTVMEGKYRPGHFKGVAMIVQKFFHIVKPDTAYFGNKDYQQVAIIRHMTNKLQLGIDIIGCPTVRENDGLAMSSRNALLTTEQRMASNIIYKTLQSAQSQIQAKTVPALQQWITNAINVEQNCDVQYVEIADPETLAPLSEWQKDQKAICCVAVFLGSVRLIDNISLFP